MILDLWLPNIPCLQGTYVSKVLKGTCRCVNLWIVPGRFEFSESQPKRSRTYLSQLLWWLRIQNFIIVIPIHFACKVAWCDTSSFRHHTNSQILGILLIIRVGIAWKRGRGVTRSPTSTSQGPFRNQMVTKRPPSSDGYAKFSPLPAPLNTQ